VAGDWHGGERTLAAAKFWRSGFAGAGAWAPGECNSCGERERESRSWWPGELAQEWVRGSNWRERLRHELMRCDASELALTSTGAGAAGT
jgi:hypothetical protein